ncbi:MAG: septum site-determining protein MinD, partial [Methanomicrobiales archaeon]|nr:septum site-determining protein MinD [Methanomicrobiales archaeon]
EDANIRRAAAYKTPVVVKYPTSDAARAFKRIASNLAGVRYEESSASSTDGFLDRFAKVLFRGKR